MFTKFTSIQTNTIRGNIIELLTAQLLRNFGYHVTPFGFEHLAQDYLNRCYLPTADASLWEGDTYQFLRRLPDLLVQDPGTSELILVEVKFRKDGILRLKDLREYQAPMVIILVSPRKIQCATLAEYKSGVRLDESTNRLLHSRTDLFRLFKPRKVKQLEWELIEYARALLEATTLPTSKDILGPMTSPEWSFQHPKYDDKTT
jgi:hypothetical protein